MVVRRTKHIPIRSCVVCRQTSEKRKLLRVVRLPEKSGGAVVVDETGKVSGRGAYVCADEKCVGLAQKQKRFERALAVSAGIIGVELFENLSSLAAKSPANSGESVVETSPTGEVFREV